MASRSRLNTSQQTTPTYWPYHDLKWAVLPAHLLTTNDRRMEAESFLLRGYGIRLAIEARPEGWVRLEELGRVRQPSRLKGILVSQEFGIPYLAATQVLDLRPVPRKWLALERISDGHRRFVERGTILVTRSGSVGRATLAFTPHLDTLITDDLLRVEAHNSAYQGWLYAFLRSQKMRSVMISSKYGHIIKHLEVNHLNSLPIPLVRDFLLKKFNQLLAEILDLRDRSYAAILEAEAHFGWCLGITPTDNNEVRADDAETGFVVNAGTMHYARGRRLDASRHIPLVREIKKQLAKNARTVERLKDCGFDIWVPGRYKRIPAEDGVIFLDSSDLFEINPDMEKRFADCRFGDDFRGRVRPGWVLMASSGQTYGLIGGAVLASDFYEDKVVANHVIRIAPREETTARSGYVLTALTHPRLGRPFVKSLAFGSSVPEISPEDIADFGLARLSGSLAKKA